MVHKVLCIEKKLVYWKGDIYRQHANISRTQDGMMFILLKLQFFKKLQHTSVAYFGIEQNN